MTRRTILGWIDPFFLNNSFCELLMIAGWYPVHVGYFFRRPEMRSGIAMTIETPPHAQRLLLLYHYHLGHITMTTYAPHTSTDVNGMIEISVLTQCVNANPLDRHARRPAFADGQQLVALGKNQCVAIHADRSRWHVSRCRFLNRIMTVAAIQTEFAGVEFVAVRNGLSWSVTDIGVLWRTVVPEKAHSQHCCGQSPAC